MAELKKETMTLEREYVVPLRRAFRNVPRYWRAKKAMSALKVFVAKHMKTTDVSIGQSANLEVWSQGIRNPPAKITIACRKYDSGKVRVEIKGVQFEDLDKKAEATAKDQKTKAAKAEAKVQDADIVATEEKKAEKSAFEKSAEAKPSKAPKKDTSGKSE